MIALITPKTAVFTPMPSAIVATATVEKTRDFLNIRRAK
jgi:hypothetical protein